jgi:hypothetical protein
MRPLRLRPSLREATDHLRQGLIIREEIGDQHGRARILRSLGGVLRDAGQIDAAYTAWSQAIAIFHDLGDSPQAELLAADLTTLSPKNLALDK